MSGSSKFVCSFCETSYRTEARLRVHEEDDHTVNKQWLTSSALEFWPRCSRVRRSLIQSSRSSTTCLSRAAVRKGELPIMALPGSF